MARWQMVALSALGAVLDDEARVVEMSTDFDLDQITYRLAIRALRPLDGDGEYSDRRPDTGIQAERNAYAERCVRYAVRWIKRAELGMSDGTRQVFYDELIEQLGRQAFAPLQSLRLAKGDS